MNKRGLHFLVTLAMLGPLGCSPGDVDERESESEAEAEGEGEGEAEAEAGADGEVPPGPDTAEPFAIDTGDDGAKTPGTYKGLWQRLTDSGEPTVTAVDGTIGVVCIGMSNSGLECTDYIDKIDGGFYQGEIAAEVKVVNCAVGGNAIEQWNDPSNDSSLWDECIDSKLGQQSIALDQVRVIYHKAANSMTVQTYYPETGSDYQNYYDNLVTFAQRVKVKFPAVQAVYTTSRMYGGFANTPGRGEPISFEEGHGLNSWLADNPSVDGVWYGWGPYIWGPDCGSGLVNGSGVCYLADDLQEDGVHPAQGARDKISQMIHARLSEHAWYAP